MELLQQWHQILEKQVRQETTKSWPLQTLLRVDVACSAVTCGVLLEDTIVGGTAATASTICMMCPDKQQCASVYTNMGQLQESTRHQCGHCCWCRCRGHVHQQLQQHQLHRHGHLQPNHRRHEKVCSCEVLFATYTVLLRLVRQHRLATGVAMNALPNVGGMQLATTHFTAHLICCCCPVLLLLLSALLIGTHLYTFLLVPASMFVSYDKVDDLKADRCRSPFVVLLGLSFTMVSLLLLPLQLRHVTNNGNLLLARGKGCI
jgi:hypothetical protein